MNRVISTPGTYVIIACAIIACAFAPVRAADMAAAKTNYDTFCAKCHGPGGKGDGPAAATLVHQPAQFHRLRRDGQDYRRHDVQRDQERRRGQWSQQRHAGVERRLRGRRDTRPRRLRQDLLQEVAVAEDERWKFDRRDAARPVVVSQECPVSRCVPGQDRRGPLRSADRGRTPRRSLSRRALAQSDRLDMRPRLRRSMRRRMPPRQNRRARDDPRTQAFPHRPVRPRIALVQGSARDDRGTVGRRQHNSRSYRHSRRAADRRRIAAQGRRRRRGAGRSRMRATIWR